MIKAWHETQTDQEAAELGDDFWSTHTQNIDAGQFWADRIKNYRGEPVERLRIAIQNLPLPAAFREAVIAIRALIREKRKLGEPHEEGITLLYWLAAVESFSVPYSDVLQQPGYNVIESIPGEVVKNLPFTYQSLGYEQLGLLNKTDVKWLREIWGEPQCHTTMHLMHINVWKKYEAELKRKEQNQVEAVIAQLTGSQVNTPTRKSRVWPQLLIALVILLFITMLLVLSK